MLLFIAALVAVCNLISVPAPVLLAASGLVLFLTALSSAPRSCFIGASLHLDADAERERDAIRGQEQRARREAAEAALVGNLLRVSYEVNVVSSATCNARAASPSIPSTGSSALSTWQRPNWRKQWTASNRA